MNEDLIRKSIIANLKILESRRQVFDVLDNCGTCEYGVDVCFKKNDIFGQPRVYGLQIKKGDINAGNIKVILGQLSIAFGHRFAFCSDRRHLEYIYVVTNGSISPTAREYFQNANTGFRNIFLIESDVLTLFLSPDIDSKIVISEN